MSGAESVQDRNGPILEAIVLIALKRQLAVYCAIARARTDIDPAQLQIRALVVMIAVTRAGRHRFHAAAQQAVRESLPGAGIRVLFEYRDGLGDPGYAINLHPPLDGPPPRAADPAPSVARSPAPSATLTLFFGEWRWRYLLYDADAWLPLGRGLAGHNGSAVHIPDFAVVVPRSALLLIHHRGGVTCLQRSDERRQFLVRLDGRPLAPGRPLAAGSAGCITYGLLAAQAGEAHTEVGYELAEGR